MTVRAYFKAPGCEILEIPNPRVANNWLNSKAIDLSFAGAPKDLPAVKVRSVTLDTSSLRHQELVMLVEDTSLTIFQIDTVEYTPDTELVQDLGGLERRVEIPGPGTTVISGPRLLSHQYSHPTTTLGEDPFEGMIDFPNDPDGAVGQLTYEVVHLSTMTLAQADKLFQEHYLTIAKDPPPKFQWRGSTLDPNTKKSSNGWDPQYMGNFHDPMGSDKRRNVPLKESVDWMLGEVEVHSHAINKLQKELQYISQLVAEINRLRAKEEERDQELVVLRNKLKDLEENYVPDLSVELDGHDDLPPGKG